MEVLCVNVNEIWTKKVAKNVRSSNDEIAVLQGLKMQNVKLLIHIWCSLAPKRNSRELKQARMATAVNKQLNFTVKNKPHTTNYIYCIFEASVWKNCIDCFAVNSWVTFTNAEKVAVVLKTEKS